jgi:ubiquinone/menaquinone biosynthesis C-methylase UbiE
VGGEVQAVQADGYAFGYQPGVQNYLRLHTVKRCAAFLTPHLTAGMSLLDAGCGPGTITVGLAAIVAPGQLAAVDISPDEVAQTEAALREAGHENARTEVASILELPFEDCSFDAVFSHAVLDYLADPVAGVLELHRVLKPGGVIGLRSVNNDLSVIGPHDALVDEGVALFRRAVASMGGDMTRGRLLGGMLKQVGFERIFATPSYERAQSREEWQSFCDAFAGALDHTTISEIGIREGWADQSRFDEIVAALRRFGTDTSNCFALARGEAVGYKTARPS